MLKRKLKYILHPFFVVYYFFIRIIRGYIGKKNPVFLTKYLYKKTFKRKLDLNSPTDLNEKICFLKLFSDTSLWGPLSDKYYVRNYILEKRLGHILVDFYGVWDDANKINFNILPNSFVLKTNNACETVILVDDKTNINENLIRKKLNTWLKWKDFGISSSIYHYSKIKPVVIAEQFLIEDKKSFSTSLIDYKIWCFNGEPYNVLVCYDRTKTSLGLSLYDLDWTDMSDKLVSSNHYKIGKFIPKPESFDEMIKISKILSKDFPQVRVDLYNINGKVYFGELTFTSALGMMTYFSKEYLLEMGSKVVLP